MTLWLVRHAHAGDRHHWSLDQDERPLSERGRTQAAEVTSLLADRGIERILSSPATRCAETVEPLADKLGLAVETTSLLYEGTSADEAMAVIDGVLSTEAVLCSHGDVIPDLLRALRRRGLESNGIGACEKGSTWELSVVNGSVVDATYHPPVG